MAAWTFTLLLLTLCLSSSALASTEAFLESVTDDPLIRQVVSEGAEVVDQLLHADHHFSLFKTKYRKSYATQEEHDYRFSVFKANMRRAKAHQLADPTAVHGVTKFSDLTPEEFERSYLGLHKQPLKLPADAKQAPKLPTSDLPADFDWRDHGAVGVVKDQGSCGSCWSFSTIGALEGAHYLATGELLSLSEQQLVDCDHECDPAERNSCDSGCNGGLMNNALEYILKAGGVQTEKDYPYTGVDGQCKFNSNGVVAGVSNFSVVSIDDDQIAANLVMHGPLAVGINSLWMQTYIGGFHALTSAASLWITLLFSLGTVQPGTPPFVSRMSLTGSSRIRGELAGEKMGTTKSAGDQIFVGWSPWSQASLQFISTQSSCLLRCSN